MLSAHFTEILQLHVGCVALSGALFTVRGVMRIADLPGANHWLLRGISYIVDTGLLGAGVLLTLIVHQYPFVDAWLTCKVLLLPLYIAFGIVALKRARTRPGRTAAFVAALVTYAYIVGVALARDPYGWLALMR